MKKKLAEAIIRAKHPQLDSINPHFNSRYASLLSVMNAVRDALAESGLAISQQITVNESKLHIKNVIYDTESGEELTFESTFPLNEAAVRDIQKCGSYITYCRRYSLLALFGLVGDPDDDGNAATEAQKDVQVKEISEGQKRKIYAMLREHGLSRNEAKSFWEEVILPNPTREHASTIIDEMDNFIKAWKEKAAASDCPFE